MRSSGRWNRITSKQSLLFIGAEFGLYFSPDGGAHWVKLEGGVPTISFRDIELQRRDNDLVGATFGRGFYVLDDYSSLREIAEGALDSDAALFPVRDAWWYVPYVPMQARGKPSLGSDDYTAPNPPFGALLTYYLKEKAADAQSRPGESARRRSEKAGTMHLFPVGIDLPKRRSSTARRCLLTVRDEDGRAVRRLEGPALAGIHRVNWDLRLPAPHPIELSTPGFRPPWASPPRGPLVTPGSYRVEMALVTAGGVETLGEPQEFEVKSVPGSIYPDPNVTEVAAFRQRTAELMRKARGAAAELRGAQERLRYMRQALTQTPGAEPSLFARMDAIEAKLAANRMRLMGDPIRGRWNEASVPSILGRVGKIAGGHWDTRQAPTSTQQKSLDVAGTEFAEVIVELRKVLETEIPGLEAELEAAGAPWTPGRKLPPQ